MDGKEKGHFRAIARCGQARVRGEANDSTRNSERESVICRSLLGTCSFVHSQRCIFSALQGSITAISVAVLRHLTDSDSGFRVQNKAATKPRVGLGDESGVIDLSEKARHGRCNAQPKTGYAVI